MLRADKRLPWEREIRRFVNGSYGLRLGDVELVWQSPCYVYKHRCQVVRDLRPSLPPRLTR
jgi:hypothetical protein